MAAAKVILESGQIEAALEAMAGQILSSAGEGVSIALVGIRSRGEILAERLRVKLEARGAAGVDCGTLDITLYRDDLDQMGYQQPTVRSTEIDFDINDRVIVLVDDVLNTGRSIRAALDALIDFGRPKAIRLAVLVDRGARELPIAADYVGKVIEAPADKRVQVYLSEVDDTEKVILE